jgi:hypothetical protein
MCMADAWALGVGSSRDLLALLVQEYECLLMLGRWELALPEGSRLRCC